MTRNFVLTAEAETDVLAIWDHIADLDSERAADRVIESIFAECQMLGEVPGVGHFREDLLDRRHKFCSVWSYLIVYRWKVTPIQIIAIVHGGRDLNAFFSRLDWP